MPRASAGVILLPSGKEGVVVCLAKGPGIAPKRQRTAPAPQGQVYKAARAKGRERGKRGFAAAGRRCFPLFTDAIFRDQSTYCQSQNLLPALCRSH